MKRSSGFTIVELAVVITVIAILATVTALGISRYLADSRDARRAASATAITDALEKYYDKNGEYPSCSAITAAASTVSTNTLKGLDQATLVVPDVASGVTNSIRCTGSLTVGGEDFFKYTGDGTAGCTGSTACATFTLQYKSEGDANIKTITSRH